MFSLLISCYIVYFWGGKTFLALFPPYIHGTVALCHAGSDLTQRKLKAAVVVGRETPRV